MKNNYRISTSFMILLVGALCVAQGVTTEVAARNAASNYLRALGLAYSVDGSSARLLKHSGSAPSVWDVTSDRAEFMLSINADNGRKVGFADIALDDERNGRKPGMARRLLTDEQVKAAGTAAIEKGDLADMGFIPTRVEWLCDEPGADRDRNNRADRVKVEFGQQVQGYGGYVNTATMSFDAVTGKLLGLSASTLWRFVPPRSRLSREEALTVLRALYAGERDRLKAAGDGDAQAFEWPGDEEVGPLLKEEIVQGGTRAFGSDYGHNLAEACEARLCWTVDMQGAYVAVDTESGNPWTAGSRKVDTRRHSQSRAAPVGRQVDQREVAQILG